MGCFEGVMWAVVGIGANNGSSLAIDVLSKVVDGWKCVNMTCASTFSAFHCGICMGEV